MDIKEDVKEDPLCQNGTLTQVGEFETVFIPSQSVEEFAHNNELDCSEMCNKIKEEPHCSEIKEELELPSAADVDLKEETASQAEVITGDVTGEEAYRICAKSPHSYINSASGFLTNFNSGESSMENNGCDVIEESQLLNYCQPQLFEGLETNYTLVHDGKISLTCNTCGESFKFLYELQHHKLVIHERLRPYKCEICNKTFVKEADLKRHKLNHGERRHTCEVCNKSFIRPADMRMHKLAHEGIRRYKCLVCDKSFTWLSNLKEHKKIHEGRKPYTCEICNKTFTQLTHLKQHKLTHEGKRPYICEVCNKSFTLVSLLKQHKIVHGEKQHTCEICKKRFTRAGYLKVHTLAHQKRMQTATPNVRHEDFNLANQIETDQVNI